MINFKKIKDNLSHNIEGVDQLNELGDDVINLSIDFLTDLEKQNTELTGFTPYKTKLSNTINQIKCLKQHPYLSKKYEIIFNQSIVLIISSFETFLGELIVEISNKLPQLINWNLKEKISVDPRDFNYSQPNFGKMVLKHIKQRHSLQDINSVSEMLNNYLSITIDKKNLNELIFYQAVRNIIVHNLSKVDEVFLHQIAKTKYHNKYSTMNDSTIKLKKNDYKRAKDIFLSLADNIIEELKKKIINQYDYDIITE